MKIPLQITARKVSVSEAVKDDIRDKVAKLEQYSDKIIGCRVTIDAPHRHLHQGIQYYILVDLSVPGSELIVSRRHDEDIYVAIRDAFEALKRQLVWYEERLRGEKKHHEAVPQATVTQLFLDEGYGFLESREGHEVYFHRNSVLDNAFDKMTVGAEVRYVEEQGDKGPQASTVVLIGAVDRV